MTIRVCIVILISGLWRSHCETLQYVSKFILLWNVKIIMNSLNGKGVQFGLEWPQVFHGWLLFCFASNNSPVNMMRVYTGS